MSGSPEGALKTAAKRIGLSVDEYLERQAAGDKWCFACKTWMPIPDFAHDRSRGDGLKASCRIHNRGLNGSPAKSERRMMAGRDLAWCRGCLAWLPQRDVRGGCCRAHSAEEARVRYAAMDRARRRARSGRAAARRRDVPPVPAIGVEVLDEIWGGSCAYCHDAATTSFDHVVPVSKGGGTSIVPACRRCNSSKSNADPGPWIERGFGVHPEPWLDLLTLLCL